MKELLQQFLPYLLTAGGLFATARLLLPWYRRLEKRKLELAVVEKEAVIESIAVKSAGEQIDRLTLEISRLTLRAQGLDELLGRAAANAREVDRLHEEQVALYREQIGDLRAQLAEARRALGR